ncbi:MAG: efflux transporter outer membrane subunit [Deltaproteobacteria bacterium]|nr:efflux transporter outer membrane subunit [Deltaproteobacteria bacterium]
MVLGWGSMRRVRVGLVALILSGAGCAMIGPDFHRPTAPVAKQWLESNQTEVDSSHPEYRNWWRVFHDLTLTRLVDSAYQQNLSLRSAGLRVLEARAQLGIAIGGFYPHQQVVSSSLNYNHLPVALPYNLSNPTYWGTSFGAQAAWELDLWGKLRRNIESADLNYLASVANYDAVLVSLTGDIATTYVQVRVLQAQMQIARANLAKQREALQIASARFHWGTATELDVDQAENVLGVTEATIPELNIQLEHARDMLSVLLGVPPAPLEELLGGPGKIPIAPARAAVGIPADLLTRRPDVQKAELDAAAQCAKIGVAKSDLLPALSLTGTVGTVATNIGSAGLGNVFNGNSLFYTVGPAVQWNLLNYGRITNNVRLQDATFEQALVDYQNTVLKAQQEVEDGLTMFVESRKQAAALKTSVAAAQRALKISLIQYTEGTVDFTTVLNAEQNLYQAQNNLAATMGNIPLGVIAAYRALGGGWQIREDQNFVPPATRAEMAARTNWGTLLSPVDLLKPKAAGLPSTNDTGPLVRPPEW